MPAERKYKSAAALAKAINTYLRSIRTKDAAKCKNVDGGRIEYETYVIPPTLGDIVHVLGISRQTWARYANGELGEDYKRVCEDAKNECERYLERELLTRRKGIDGVKFNLQCNHGWSEKKSDEAAASRGIVITINGDDELSR